MIKRIILGYGGLLFIILGCYLTWGLGGLFISAGFAALLFGCANS